jgi:hypothetical protein
VDRLDFGGGAEDTLAEFLSVSRLIAGAIGAGAQAARDAAEESTASRPAGPPIYVPMRTLIVLFPILLVLGFGCGLLGWAVYPESIPTARIFVLSGLFLFIPGIIGTPLALIHRIKSKKAGRR